jgi:hypothetical protein
MGNGRSRVRQPRRSRGKRDDARYWFHEHFHGDTGAGLGASHQTGWTGLVAKLIQHKASTAN